MSNDIIFDTPDKIQGYRMLALRSRLKLEAKIGMPFSSRGPTTGNMVREVIGSKTRNRRKLLKEFNEWLKKNYPDVAACIKDIDE